MWTRIQFHTRYNTYYSGQVTLGLTNRNVADSCAVYVLVCHYLPPATMAEVACVCVCVCVKVCVCVCEGGVFVYIGMWYPMATSRFSV